MELFARETRSVGIRPKLHPDGTVTIYHGTTPERAKVIIESGRFEELSFFSHARSRSAFGSAGAAAYGKEVIEIKADPRAIHFNHGTGEIEASRGLVRERDGIWYGPDKLNTELLMHWYQQALKDAAHS
jgi:hypothetical protein